MYDDELDDGVNVVEEFLDKMLMAKMFRGIPEQFTYSELIRRFKKTFPKVSSNESGNMIEMCISMEWIEVIDEENQIFQFNGINFGDTDLLS